MRSQHPRRHNEALPRRRQRVVLIAAPSSLRWWTWALTLGLFSCSTSGEQGVGIAHHVSPPSVPDAAAARTDAGLPLPTADGPLPPSLTEEVVPEGTRPIEVTSGGEFAWLELLLARNGSGRDIDTYPDGSVAITGVYFDWLILDAETAEPSEFTHDEGESRVFVAKYDAQQRLLWSRDTEPEGGSYSRSLVVRPDGAVAVSGNYSNGSFDLGAEGQEVHTLPGLGGTDAFLALYTSDGELSWVRGAGSTDNETFSEVVALPDNSLVVVGNDEGDAPGVTTVFAPGEANETAISTRGGFVARYSPEGDLMWAQSTGGTTAWDVALSPMGSILVAGYLFDGVTIAPGQPNEQKLQSQGARDIYIASYDIEGALEWVRQYGAATNDQPTDFTVGPDGAMWLSTNSSTFPDDPTRDREYFSSLGKLSPTGELQWLQTGPGSLTYRGELAPLSDGSCAMASRLEGEITVEVVGQGEVTFESNDEANLLLRRYAPDGQLLWAKRAGGVGRDQDAVDGIAAFADDTIVVTGGLFLGPALFGEGEAGELRFSVEEARVPFFAKFAP